MKSCLEKLLGFLRSSPLLTQIYRKLRDFLTPHTELEYTAKNLNPPNFLNKKSSILFATSIGAERGVWKLETLLSKTMLYRGFRSDFLVCDKVLTGCQRCLYQAVKDEETFIKLGPNRLCDSCYDPLIKSAKILNENIISFGKFLNNEDYINAKKLSLNLKFSEIINFHVDNISIGEHALAGALRFFAKSTLKENSEKEILVLRRYFEAAYLTYLSASKLFSQNKYSVLVLHHGIYVPQGILADVATAYNVRVVVWNIAYRKNRFIFSHDKTYHHELMEEPTSKWNKLNLDYEKEKQLDEYLLGRWYGKYDWINFQSEQPNTDLNSIVRKLNLDLQKPTISLLTNVLWDAQLHYPNNVFKNLLEWLFVTIDHFIADQSKNLIIRIHPAEIRGRVKSRQPIYNEIVNKYPNLPNNIEIIRPEDNVSTYSLVDISQTSLIYGTKMGVELTSRGIPVIVCGEAWIRNKGLTVDIESKKHYLDLLDKAPLPPMDSAQILEAKKYAYHFFFRRMIPINALQPIRGWPPFKINVKDVTQIQEGNDSGLDAIVNGILHGSDFIYDE